MHTVSSKLHNKSGHPAQQTRGYAAHREAAAKCTSAVGVGLPE